MADLASRITTAPVKDAPATDAPADAPADPPSTDWADDKPDEPASVDAAQVDGAVPQHGGSGLEEPEYEVEVTLNELQTDSTTPFYGGTTWEGMGL